MAQGSSDPQFTEKLIDAKKIRRRWFRNHYVLLDERCYAYDTWVVEAGKMDFDPLNVRGEFYGPFWNKKEAESFEKNIRHYIYCAIFA